jgi:L-threonylcarbamoyladenylate synthase
MNIKTKILSPSPENILLAAQALLAGEVVAMPTETVYGLAGNIHSPQAIENIFNIKERPTYDPLIVHVYWERKSENWGLFSLQELEKRKIIDLASIPVSHQEKISKLIEAFWPGPLTLVLPKHPSVSDAITSGLPTVGIRMPKHPVAQALLSNANISLAAPSANLFGRISPTSATDVMSELSGRFNYILDGGSCQIGVESTVLYVADSSKPLMLLRPGGISQAQIEKIINEKIQLIDKKVTGVEKNQLMSPGLLEGHYAPKKPLEQLPNSLMSMTDQELKSWWEDQKKITSTSTSTSTFPLILGFLLIQGDPLEAQNKLQRVLGLNQESVIVESLSSNGDLEEVARNLFHHLRHLDQSNATLLFNEPCILLEGFGAAIADRLHRANHK